MHINLSGKKALVTASTGGIGYAIATGLALTGAEVILNGRSERSLEKALAQLIKAVPQAKLQGVIADLSTSEGASTLIKSVSVVDILVNNAGTYKLQDFFEGDDGCWEEAWETNLMSGVRLSRALVPAMIERGWGRVVFIASESARNIPADMIHYGVSKTAQLSLSRGLAKRVAGTGVTVNCVLPGPTLSDGLAEMFKADMQRTGKSLESIAAGFIMAHRPTSLLKRASTVDEVANMVVYICSRQASATSGAALRVDGGIVDDIV